jgi:hypothetical protein
MHNVVMVKVFSANDSLFYIFTADEKIGMNKSFYELVKIK